MIVALLLRPLLILTACPGKVITRILADDLLIVGLGDGHLADFVIAYSKALRFISDMGSKVAAQRTPALFAAALMLSWAWWSAGAGW